jgi:DNA-binding transcriptional ArsR family regulator
MLTKSSIEAVQLMGGDGATRFYPVEGILREAKVTQIAGGTSEAMKLLIYRLGLREFADELEVPRRIMHETLGVPMITNEPLAKQANIEETNLLAVLAEDYRINPGLYMNRDDLLRNFDVPEADLDRVLAALEEKKLVKLYRKRGNIELAKATYTGLKQAHPAEYYRWFPARVKENEIF